MFGKPFRTPLHQPGLSVTYLPAYSSLHRLCCMGLFGYLHCSLHVIGFCVNMRTNQKRGKTGGTKLCILHKMQNPTENFSAPAAGIGLKAVGKTAIIPSVNKEQHGFSGHLEHLAALSSLPGGSPAASSALPAAQSAPEKLRRTCQREKIRAGKEEDAGGLALYIPTGSPEARFLGPRVTPAKDDDAASVDFGRWQAYCPLSTEGIRR